jgi:hypothetical protein
MSLHVSDPTDQRLTSLPEEANVSHSRELRPRSATSNAIGALALGAVALGALAIGALAIGRLAIGRARIRRLEIDELVVRKLRVTEQLRTPPKSGPES